MEKHTRPEHDLFRQAIRALTEAGVPFVIGGAFAVHHYSGDWRDTHDLDIYLERAHVPDAVRVLTDEGFRDGGEMAAGDREWIYHAMKDGALVDLIWQSPHRLSVVNESFYERGREGEFLGLRTRFLPPEELLLAKIYTINQHRCDWPDVLHVVRSCPDDFDWQLVLDKMGENWPVLLSFVVLFDWVYPNEWCCIPKALREELLRRKQASHLESGGSTREAILDPWIYTRPIPP